MITPLQTSGQGVRQDDLVSTPELAEGLQIVAMTGAHAADICTWRYPAPYDCYDMKGADPAALTDPELGFHALVAGERLVGFRSFGPDGQVPGGVYDGEALDTGGGLRPELVGRGLGRQALATGLAFGRARFAPRAFRVTVASFNTRALRTVEGLGFERVDRFAATSDGSSFEVLVRPER